MPLKITIFCKWLWALITWKRFLTCVGSLMNFNIAISRKWHWALFTWKRFLTPSPIMHKMWFMGDGVARSPKILLHKKWYKSLSLSLSLSGTITFCPTMNLHTSSNYQFEKIAWNNDHMSQWTVFACTYRSCPFDNVMLHWAHLNGCTFSLNCPYMHIQIYHVWQCHVALSALK